MLIAKYTQHFKLPGLIHDCAVWLADLHMTG